ncbi:MAG: hypothetical protein AB1861_07125 [Cyanobacteriota bacterium]
MVGACVGIVQLALVVVPADFELVVADAAYSKPGRRATDDYPTLPPKRLDFKTGVSGVDTLWKSEAVGDAPYRISQSGGWLHDGDSEQRCAPNNAHSELAGS